MENTINVKLPRNVSAGELSLFAPFTNYTVSPLRIENLENVFVSFSGLCIQGNKLIGESHHDYPQMFNDFRAEANYYYYDAQKNPENLIVLDDENTYLLIHHSWSRTYYHWICESILRLWIVKDRLDKLVLILPEMGNNYDFIKSSLYPFKFKSIFYIPDNKSLLIKNLCLPQIKPVVDSYFYESLIGIRNFFKDYALSTKNLNINLGERLYISRKNASRKKIENEKELEVLLAKYDFKIINNEDYGFWEQVAIYSNCQYVVSIHGSGLTNMLFMKDKSTVFEFHKKKTNEKDWHSHAFWYLSDALNFEYYHQICEPTNLNDNYFEANFIVDIKLFEMNLIQMFAS